MSLTAQQTSYEISSGDPGRPAGTWEARARAAVPSLRLATTSCPSLRPKAS